MSIKHQTEGYSDGEKLDRSGSRRVQMVVYWVAVVLLILGVLVSVITLNTYALARSDFLQDYEAAEAMWAGASIYNPDFSKENNHPPFTALVFVPLTVFSPATAFRIWGAINICMYVWLLWRIKGTLELDLGPHFSLLILAGSLIWHPFVSHLALGQISIAVAFLIVAAWWLLRSDRQGWAGVLLGFAAAFKLYPVLFALYLLLRKNYKALGIMVLTAVVFSLLPLIAVAPKDYIYYATSVLVKNSESFVTFPANVSGASLIGRLLVDGPWVEPLWVLPGLARWLTWVGTFLCLIVLVRQQHCFPHTTFGNDAAWGGVCVALLLLTPVSWQHAFPILLLPLGLLWRLYQKSPSNWLRQFGLLAFLSFSLPDFTLGRLFMTWSAPHRMTWIWALVMALPTFGLLLLWWLLHRVMLGSGGYSSAVRESMTAAESR